MTALSDPISWEAAYSHDVLGAPCVITINPNTFYPHSYSMDLTIWPCINLIVVGKRVAPIDVVLLRYPHGYYTAAIRMNSMKAYWSCSQTSSTIDNFQIGLLVIRETISFR